MAHDHFKSIAESMWALLLLWFTITSKPCFAAESSSHTPLQKRFINMSSSTEIPANCSSTTQEPQRQSNASSYRMLLNFTAPTCEYMQWSTRNLHQCYRDKLCVLYNDCCYETIEDIISKETNNYADGRITGVFNSLRNNFAGRAISMVKYSSCVTDTRGMNGYPMITQCRTSNHELQAKCSAYNVYRYDNVPVEIVDINGNLITFSNIFCAKCHGIAVKQVKFWTVLFQCPTDQIIREDMNVSQIANICAINLKSSYTRITPRYCTPTYVCTGYNADTNDDLVALCETYNHHVVYEVGQSRTIYKNPHCAACSVDGLSVENLTCYFLTDDLDDKDSESAGKQRVDLHVLFDFNSDDGVVTQLICDSHKPCTQNEIYDCAGKTCRPVICPTGQRYYNGECITTTHEQPIFDAQMPLDNGAIIGNDTLMIGMKEDAAHMYTLKDIGQFLELLNSYAKSTKNVTFNIEHVSSLLIANEDHFCVKIEGNVPIFSSVQLVFEAMTELNKRYQRYLGLTVQNYENVSLLYCKDGLLVVEENPHLRNGHVTMSEYKVKPSIENGKWKVQLTDTMTLETFVTCLHERTYPDMNCLMFSYQMNEVTFDNKIMYVINTSLIFLPTEYRLHEKHAYVCTDSISRWPNVFEYSSQFRLLSIITSSFSLIALSLIVLVHAIIPRLRNIHGLNLTALSLTMLLIHALLLIQVSIGDSTLCIIYAVVLHWLLLTMFMWMNIIGFDMAMLFKSKVTISQTDALPRFKKYLLIAFTIPSTFICISVGLNFTDFSLRPGYGERGYCWIAYALALFVFVWSPIVIALLVNAGLFAFTVYTIQGARRSAKYVKNNKSGSHNAYFFVYLKMTVILGLTWLIAFLGPIVRVEAVWIMHIILNGLQGVSLLICFVLNSRVIAYARNRGCQSTDKMKTKSKHDLKTQERSLNKL